MPDFWAQMRHPRPLYAPLPLSNDSVIRAAQDADRAFRLLYVSIYNPRFYNTQPLEHVESVALGLKW